MAELEITYVAAEPVTPVNEGVNSPSSVDNTPVSTEFGRFDDIAGVKDPLVTLVTNKDIPPFWK